MGYGNSLFVYISWLVVCFFSVYALFHSFLNLKNKLNIFIILMFIGILISVPFAPPIDSESMRTYAATIPVVMLLPSMGIAKLLKNINFYNKSKFTINQELNQYLMIIFSSIMVSLIILIPIFIKILNKPFILQVNQCTGQKIPILFKLNYGSYVTITPDDTMCGDTPNLCLSKFINNGSVGLVEIYQIIVDSIKNSKTPIIFTAVNDLITGHYYHLLIQKKDFHNLLEHNLVVSGCLHEIDKKEFLYSADSLIINIIN